MGRRRTHSPHLNRIVIYAALSSAAFGSPFDEPAFQHIENSVVDEHEHGQDDDAGK